MEETIKILSYMIKAGNTFSFKVYGRILIELKYYETDKVDLEIPSSLLYYFQ
jgi:hypothetical protein